MSPQRSIGVCLLPEPAPNRGRTVSYTTYFRQVLAHLGLCYQDVRHESLADQLPGLGVLVTVGDMAFSPELTRTLEDWLAAGGAWLAIGSTCGCDEMFGVETQAPTFVGWASGVRSLGEGYLRPLAQHPAVEHVKKPLHFFGGGYVRPTDGTVLADALDKHGREDGAPALVEKHVGRGRAMLLCVDLTGTIVRVQQGIAVTRDGVAARDGCGPVDDGVLKTGDGGVLDWQFDRDPVPGVDGLNAYLRPVVDLWQELLLRCVATLAEASNTRLALLWYWPRNLPAIGHVSHDTDGNDPHLADVLLASLNRAGIRSTWCVIPPSYEADVIDRVRAAGHELAMHYDAMTEGLDWAEANFDAQWRLLNERLGVAIVTNKNHYLRWEGDVEFFEWCVRRQIKMDQSKGPSKNGEAGFNFGTCHSYFPVAFDGRVLDVIELPTLTQDLAVFAPPALGTPLLEAAVRAHGVAHFLFHPAHFGKEAVAPAMESVVQQGRRHGLEWWTGQEINAWERARRSATWTSQGGTTRLRVGADLPQATLLVRGGTLSLNGRPTDASSVRRWGLEFQSVTADLWAGHEYAVRVG